MAGFNINGTNMTGGSSTFAVAGTYGTILNTDSSGNVYNSSWQVRGTAFGNGWYELDRTWRGSENPYISRFAKQFYSSAAADINIFKFTPNNGWTYYWMGMEVYNIAQHGTGYGRWIFPTNDSQAPGYSPGLSTIQSPQGGYQGANAPILTEYVNTPPFPDGGYWTAQVKLNMPTYSVCQIILEIDRNVQTPVTSITGKWQVALQ